MEMAIERGIRNRIMGHARGVTLEREELGARLRESFAEWRTMLVERLEPVRSYVATHPGRVIGACCGIALAFGLYAFRRHE
jgi:hypothetical protein